VFQKLYIDTRSQAPHYLEFTLWIERENTTTTPATEIDCFNRETFYPVLGTNTFRTPLFIPHTPTPFKAQTSTDEVSSTSEHKIELLQFVPQKGRAGETVYLTFKWNSSKDSCGDILVIWNDEILHLPFFSNSANERIVAVEQIPASSTASVPVYLQEKPPQDSRAVGVRSNTLFWRYANTESEFDSLPALTSTNGNDASSEPTGTKRPHSSTYYAPTQSMTVLSPHVQEPHLPTDYGSATVTSSLSFPEDSTMSSLQDFFPGSTGEEQFDSYSWFL